MRTAKGLSAAVIAVCALCATVARAGAQIAFAPCGNTNDFACGHLQVPLDPSGRTPGQLTLALRRHRAAVGESNTAIVALAGGPGQSALPFAQDFGELLGPIAATRDLIVFDQRGVGLSGPLSCHALEQPRLFHTPGNLIEACASQLGPTRVFYTTAATVADIEAIREAGGYEKLLLYGTSYGTKVAEEYAQAHPKHVAGLVLDSVVTPEGPETLGRSTFAAIPRVLRELCDEGACVGVTREPVADLARVSRRMRHAPLHAHAIDGSGHAHSVAISADDLVNTLLAGDFSPLLRADFVTATSAAANGDSAPLARLLAVTGASEEGEAQDFDTPLYLATSCEEQTFPWNRASNPRARIAEATAAAAALGPSAFAPFSAANAIDLSDVPTCAYWPFSSPASPDSSTPMPDVPTLILSGAADLRTPTSGARALAAQIPDARLVVVPHTGHSVLGTEIGSCAKQALQEMFTESSGTHPPAPNAKSAPCHSPPLPSLLFPPPLPPVRLALVPPLHDVGGVAGRTADAVALTLEDLGRQLLLQVGPSAGAEGTLSLTSLQIGGLRAGWASYASGSFTFHGYSYVPGVTVSGTIRGGIAALRIGGYAAAHGTLRLGAHESLVGILGGHRVQVPANASATTAIVGFDAQAASVLDRRGTGGRPAAMRLADLVGRVLWR